MKGGEAERLVESWLQMSGWTTHRAAATGFHRFAKKDGSQGFAVKSHDLFGCLDILAFRLNPGQIETRAIQVTTQGGRTARRRKIEKHAWPASWGVLLISHETTPDPAHRGRKKHFLKIEEYINTTTHAGSWTTPEAVEINVKAIEAFRKARAAEKAKA